MKLLGFACAIFSLAASTAGCGSEFESAGTTTTSGAGAAGGEGGRGQGGDAGQGGDGQGGAGGGGGNLCAAGSTPGPILLWTTLNDAASIAQPKMGSGEEAGFVTGPLNDFVPALSGKGIKIDTSGEYVRFRALTANTSNFDPQRGTIDFCYRPQYPHTDAVDHALFGADLPSNGFLRVRKAGATNENGLQVIAYNGTSLSQTHIPAANYELVASTWYRMTISWDYTLSIETQVHVYIDGAEVFDPMAPVGLFSIPQAGVNEYMYIGAWSPASDSPNALGVIDEFVIYGEPIVP